MLGQAAEAILEPSRSEGSGHLETPDADGLVEELGARALPEGGDGVEGLLQKTPAQGDFQSAR